MKFRTIYVRATNEYIEGEPWHNSEDVVLCNESPIFISVPIQSLDLFD